MKLMKLEVLYCAEHQPRAMLMKSFFRYSTKNRGGVIAAIAMLFCSAWLINGCSSPGGKKTPAIDKNAVPALQLSDLDGNTVSLADFKGRAVFVNFWATWCGPCIREMPSIKALRDSMEKNNIVFLFVSNETKEEIAEFEKESKCNFRYLLISNLEETGIEGLPTTFIYNSDGALVFTETGARRWDDAASIKLLTEINNRK
jgi:thiol-disulfide isomerase/thioredoxin